ncbi:ribonuclease HI [Aliarcobacter lanthieri]|uniref:ribonuclease HI n=1 Tax=Aliarcobacter lanthieri TaxID=1355374 RepID=UPI00047AAA6A|nr:ribonuclease H family protein [Aliarcobacter lanthieri]QKF59658.1 ribonuclease HI [Aliarcobacter lanthieri]
MNIDKKLLELITYNNKLNESQFKILDIQLDNHNWQDVALKKDISKNDINLLMLLRGDFSISIQEQIIKNYHTILEHNNIQAKVYTPTIKEENQNIENEKEYIKIYCDGACSGNPGNAGSGLAIYSNNKNPILIYGAYVENGTNNIAELNALLKALNIASQTNSKNKISILTDSKYSIECVTTWAYSWKKNAWSKKGGEIKNLEIIQEAHYLYEKIKDKIEIIHVKGHSGVEGNELADRMAVNAIKEKKEDFTTYSYNKIEDVLTLKSY